MNFQPSALSSRDMHAEPRSPYVMIENPYGGPDGAAGAKPPAGPTKGELAVDLTTSILGAGTAIFQGLLGLKMTKEQAALQQQASADAYKNTLAQTELINAQAKLALASQGQQTATAGTSPLVYVVGGVLVLGVLGGLGFMAYKLSTK